MVSTLTNVLKSTSSFKPLERAHAMHTFWANSLDDLLLWNPALESQWMAHPSSMMYREQWFLSKYGTTIMLFKSESCLKYSVPHLFVPPPFWSLILNNLEACAFDKMYLHLFDTMSLQVYVQAWKPTTYQTWVLQSLWDIQDHIKICWFPCF